MTVLGEDVHGNQYYEITWALTMFAVGFGSYLEFLTLQVFFSSVDKQKMIQLQLTQEVSTWRIF